jgi:hypothetical protein
VPLALVYSLERYCKTVGRIENAVVIRKKDMGDECKRSFVKKTKDHLRNRFVFLQVLMVVNPFTANAGRPVSFGLKMEANIHEFWLYDLDDIESCMGIAPGTGCFLKIDLNGAFAIQPELSLFFRNTRIKIDGRDDYFRQWGMSVPVYLVGHEYIDNSIWYFGIGPHVQIGFDAHTKETAKDLYRTTEGAASMNRWDYGISSMLGCELHNGIKFNVGLQLGFKDQLKALGKEYTAINKTVVMGIGYHF